MLTVSALTLLVVAIAGPVNATDPSAPKPGELVFQTEFDTSQQREMWSKADFAEWEVGHQGTTSLCITIPTDQARGSNMVRLPLDLTRYRGCRLLFDASRRVRLGPAVRLTRCRAERAAADGWGAA